MGRSGLRDDVLLDEKLERTMFLVKSRMSLGSFVAYPEQLLLIPTLQLFNVNLLGEHGRTRSG